MASLNSFFLLDCTNPFQYIYTAECIVPISAYNALSAVNVKHWPTFFTCISLYMRYCVDTNLHIGAQTFNFPCSRRDLHKSLLHLMLKLPWPLPTKCLSLGPTAGLLHSLQWWISKPLVEVRVSLVSFSFREFI